ncbi:hypothetical protein SPRG_06090 [Saprolegnia parasitica CBS 223.65]|uniref:Uncharacterized protein n=1 Tax=Saprolegnia parasitica (strain CBS 223.65) TaxID=695850 RepID=A0A067CIM3_SAPPC|nr:hypothetical protein SPRG_06090 [Saprolegnia parasitica CBS 223.65]KDO29035.1 hypothetical protein SPRG_06090 [Saprolegnia parasitica CBS 223.65]|eukprot:XP_012200205.1 hypothetical protein SPRG_06090 [Saprolegnia parasitica CBS 223.65]
MLLYDVPRSLLVLMACVGFLVIATTTSKSSLDTCPRLALMDAALPIDIVCQQSRVELNLSLAPSPAAPPLKKKKKKTKAVPDKDLAFKLLLLGLFLMVVTTLF